MDPYAATSRAATGARTTRLRPRTTLIFRSARALPLLGLLLAAFAVPAGASAATTTPTPTTTATTTVKWDKPIALEKPTSGGISAVSCPTSTLCIAVDQKGRAVVSNKPTGGVKSWKFFKIDTVAPLTGISCPTANLCVAVDSAGDVTRSTHPTLGAKYWSKPVRIDPTQANSSYVGLAAISCPTTKLCVAVDNAPDGNVVTTTTPTGNAKSWTVSSLVPASRWTRSPAPAQPSAWRQVRSTTTRPHPPAARPPGRRTACSSRPATA